MKTVPLIGVMFLLVSSGYLTHFTNLKKGGGDIIYTNIEHGRTSAGDVIFSHDFHTRVPNLDCATCHASLFEMNRDNFTAIKANNERVHAYLDKDRYCGQCHNNRSAFNTDNCNLCHEKE